MKIRKSSSCFPWKLAYNRDWSWTSSSSFCRLALAWKRLFSHEHFQRLLIKLESLKFPFKISYQLFCPFQTNVFSTFRFTFMQIFRYFATNFAQWWLWKISTKLSRVNRKIVRRCQMLDVRSSAWIKELQLWFASLSSDHKRSSFSSNIFTDFHCSLSSFSHFCWFSRTLSHWWYQLYDMQAKTPWKRSSAWKGISS